MTLPLVPSNRQEFFELVAGFPQGAAIAPVASSGLITCVTNANMADSDYITVGDGINPALLFEYDKSANGVTSGRVAVTAGAGTAAQTATAFYNALVANLPALTFVDNGDGTISVTHKVPGLVGNVTITENVANAGFLVSGLSGGKDANTISATATSKLMTAPRAIRVDSVELDIPAGFTQDASSYWTIALKKGSTVIASWSTQTSAQGTIAADTFVALVLSGTDANLVAQSGDVLSLVLTKAASAANLPPGRLIAHCRYV